MRGKITVLWIVGVGISAFFIFSNAHALSFSRLYATVSFDPGTGRGQFNYLLVNEGYPDPALAGYINWIYIGFDHHIFSGASFATSLSPLTGWNVALTPDLFAGSAVGNLGVAPPGVGLPNTLSFTVDFTLTPAGIPQWYVANNWYGGIIGSQSYVTLDTGGGGFGGNSAITPEPATLFLLGSGLLGIGVWCRIFGKKAIKQLHSSR